MRTLFAMPIMLLLAAGCEAGAVDATPERAVAAFIERMESVHGDSDKGRAALLLLSQKGRTNLEQRAERASAAAGRKLGAEEMLTPSRFEMNFHPKAYRSEISGEYARVFISGESPGEQAEAHCVRENGNWRVIVDFPELPTIRHRGD